MRFALSAVILAAALAGPALADGPKTYAFQADANYCPKGLQPVTMNGVICCGQPSQSQSYQQVMRHPVAKTYSAKRLRRADICAEGVKGCY